MHVSLMDCRDDSSAVMIGLTVDCFLFIDPAFELMELKSISSWPVRGMIPLGGVH
jgi:hypothetical protein